MKLIALTALACLALSSCAHSPVTAPCGAVQLAGLNGAPCDPKPINFAMNDYFAAHSDLVLD